jgi:hypothetical protein
MLISHTVTALTQIVLAGARINSLAFADKPG